MSQPSKTVHLLPIKSASDKAVLPITRGDLDSDCVEILADPELDEGEIEQYEDILSNLLGIQTNVQDVEISYAALYKSLHDIIHREMSEGNDVWVNVTDIGTDAYVAGIVASTVQFQNPDWRQRIFVYRATDDGFERLSTVPDPSVPEFGAGVMHHLHTNGNVRSVSELAERMHGGEDEFESFRSRVQYNTEKLEKAGFVKREEVGNRMEPQLSKIGRIWVELENTDEQCP